MLGFAVLESLPDELRPLTNAVVGCYRQYHRDVRSVYAVGSVALGEWTEGTSDLDVIGVVDCIANGDDAARRRDLTLLGDASKEVSFVNNFVLGMDALRSRAPNVMTVGLARIIAVCGLNVWGEVLDFKEYFPDVKTMAYERTARAKILIDQYRAGVINEPSRSNPRMLARSSAKAAIRALSGITILRGAVFYSSPQKTVAMVGKYAPEAVALADQALAIVNGADANPSEAMRVAEQAVALFSDLYPDFSGSLEPPPQ